MLVGRGLEEEQNYSICMTENCKFLGLGGPFKNSLSRGDMDIFWNYTKITVDTFLSFTRILSKYYMPTPLMCMAFAYPFYIHKNSDPPPYFYSPILPLYFMASPLF